MRNVLSDPEVSRLFSAEEREWLEAYVPALDELCSGARAPRTNHQEAFIAVARGEAEPTTPYERLWLRFAFVRRLLEDVNRLRHAVEALVHSDSASFLTVLGIDQAVSLRIPSLLRTCAEACLRGKPYDPQRAHDLAFRAAEMGDGPAAHFLGVIYEYGLGRGRDIVGALSWYRIAATRGVGEAEEKVRTLVPPDPSRAGMLFGDGSSRTQPRDSGYDAWNRDELGPEDWESALGGPDDDQLERY